MQLYAVDLNALLKDSGHIFSLHCCCTLQAQAQRQHNGLRAPKFKSNPAFSALLYHHTLSSSFADVPAARMGLGSQQAMT